MRSVVGEYLEAIYCLHAEGEDAYAVTLAELFGVSRANASATVDRLARDGLVLKHGRQVLLTPAGRERAEAGLRRHRVTERFLVDVLGIDWTTVHQQARVFERGLGSLLDERIEQRMAWPRSCPHGNPVPRPDLDAASYLQDHHALRLDAAPRHAPLVVLTISELIEDQPDLLRICAEAGLQPGNALTVLIHDETSLTLQTLPNSPDGAAAPPERRSLALTLAHSIWVTTRAEQETS